MPIVNYQDDRIHFPVSMTGDEISDVLGALWASTQAVGEFATTMATGAAGEVSGGLAGIAAGGDADVVRRVQDAMTYQPRTRAGQMAMQSIANDMSWLAEESGLNNVSDYWRQTVVPKLQDNLGVVAGSALAAGGLAALTAMGEVNPGGRAARTASRLRPNAQVGSLGDQSLRFMKQAVGKENEFRSYEGERGIERGKRSLADRASLSAIEKESILKSIAADDIDISPKDAFTAAREWKKKHPSNEWEVPDIAGVEGSGKNISVKPKSIAYRYDIDPYTGKKAEVGSPHYEKVVGGVANEIIDIARRAEAGDPSAIKVMDNSGWYKNVERRMRNEYGTFSEMMGDVLGATSPNTPVATNFRFSQDILKKATRGDFDNLMDGFADNLDRRYELEGTAAKYLEDQRAGGRTKKAASQDPEYKEMVNEAKGISSSLRDVTNTIKQDNGRNFGMNGYNSMIALADKWRELRVGGAPKARNFSGNLTGASDKATIDVWAARNLRRHSGLKPIPSAAESGVKGKIIDAENFINDGEFGFGQSVLDDATMRINAELGLDIEPRDLQALQWFAEKDYWTKRGWTSAAGEGGSFETMMDVDPVNSRFLGQSREQSMEYQGQDFVPTPEESYGAARGIVDAGVIDPDVRAVKGNATQGKYMNDPETAMDIEVVTSREDIPTSIMNKAVDQAILDKQDSFFMAQRIPDDLGIKSPESFSVGSEVYFNSSVDTNSDLIANLQKDLNDQGIPAYTLITDPRDQNKISGLRYLDIPQFYDPENFAKISPQDYKKHVENTHERYRQIGEGLKSKYPEVKAAEPSFFDINVKSNRSAQEFAAQRKNPARDPDVLNSEFFGYKPALTRFKEFGGEVRPYYSGHGADIGSPSETGLLGDDVSVENILNGINARY
jgi:hypothetical protein